MLLPYKLIGSPCRYKNGHGQLAKNYTQKFRLLSDPPRKVRSVSLKTYDKELASRRAIKYVDDKIQQLAMQRDPKLATINGTIHQALDEYIQILKAQGNSPKHIQQTEQRIKRLIGAAGFQSYAEVDEVKVTRAIKTLQEQDSFTTNTANKYLEAMRVWSHWMYKNKRWDNHVLARVEKIKGDTTNSRPRAILTDEQFEKLLKATRKGPTRRNLTGEQRYWLYLLASQTGLRAQELNSLTPESFCLDVDAPFVQVHCTISKRRQLDRIILHPEFVQILRPWLKEQPAVRRLWSNSSSWWYKAAATLREDLEAANLPTTIATADGEAVVDFHAFRGYRVSAVIRSGATLALVKDICRLSCESLVEKYTKIHPEEVVEVVGSVPVPKLLGH
ncbi:MAG: site-specific recombinase XerD [Pirellulaceae bacterium]|jgi:site-specific recombinase XerD